MKPVFGECDLKFAWIPQDTIDGQQCCLADGLTKTTCRSRRGMKFDGNVSDCVGYCSCEFNSLVDGDCKKLTETVEVLGCNFICKSLKLTVTDSEPVLCEAAQHCHFHLPENVFDAKLKDFGANFSQQMDKVRMEASQLLQATQNSCEHDRQGIERPQTRVGLVIFISPAYGKESEFKELMAAAIRPSRPQYTQSHKTKPLESVERTMVPRPHSYSETENMGSGFCGGRRLLMAPKLQETACRTGLIKKRCQQAQPIESRKATKTADDEREHCDGRGSIMCQQPTTSGLAVVSLDSRLDAGRFGPFHVFQGSSIPRNTPITQKRQRYFFGLPNLGNTCYINAALNVIMMCTTFTERILRFAKRYGSTDPRLRPLSPPVDAPPLSCVNQYSDGFPRLPDTCCPVVNAYNMLLYVQVIYRRFVCVLQMHDTGSERVASCGDKENNRCVESIEAKIQSRAGKQRLHGRSVTYRVAEILWVAIKRNMAVFDNCDMHDSHEFLSKFLDRLQLEMNSFVDTFPLLKSSFAIQDTTDSTGDQCLDNGIERTSCAAAHTCTSHPPPETADVPPAVCSKENNKSSLPTDNETVGSDMTQQWTGRWWQNSNDAILVVGCNDEESRNGDISVRNSSGRLGSQSISCTRHETTEINDRVLTTSDNEDKESAAADDTRHSGQATSPEAGQQTGVRVDPTREGLFKQVSPVSIRRARMTRRQPKVQSDSDSQTSSDDSEPEESGQLLEQSMKQTEAAGHDGNRRNRLDGVSNDTLNSISQNLERRCETQSYVRPHAGSEDRKINDMWTCDNDDKVRLPAATTKEENLECVGARPRTDLPTKNMIDNLFGIDVVQHTWCKNKACDSR
eukprot:GHVQ01040787.1.p1 GENE.GHVQ01040787.1~~GHVQ01040787.1.p1  ORF type:complete len:852 (+),score=109.43 GHVQ01040787.1:149-2704(+)